MIKTGFPKHWSTLEKLIWLRGSPAGGTASYDTITGNPVQFTALASPLKQLSVAFSPVQSGSGDPSPDNPLPISGWDGVTVWRTGKNLLNPNANVNSTYTSSIADALAYFKSTGKYATGYVSSSNAITSNSEYITSFTPIKSGVEYSIKNADPSKNFSSVCFLDEDGNIISRHTAWSTAKYTHTALANEKYIMCGSRDTDIGTATIAIGDTVPTTVEDFIPYNPSSTSISISFGQTVYSGTLDVLTGVVTVDWAACHLKDTNTITQSQASADGYLYIVKPPMTAFAIIPFTQMFCNCYEFTNPNQMGASTTAGKIGWYIAGTNRFCNISSIAQTEADFRTELETLDPIVVCKLTNPQTIQLTPQELSSLAGENVAWASTNGDMEITYRSA